MTNELVETTQQPAASYLAELTITSSTQTDTQTHTAIHVTVHFTLTSTHRPTSPPGRLGSVVVGRRTRDRDVASSTPGRCIDG